MFTNLILKNAPIAWIIFFNMLKNICVERNRGRERERVRERCIDGSSPVNRINDSLVVPNK